jgi:hypothetical protein
MESTNTAWAVVSDPFAPESSWIPACVESADVQFARQPAPQRCKLRRTCEVIVSSGTLALLGGVLAGQSVHLLYFAQHLVAQFICSDYQYAPWSDFYFWFNQPNAVMVYMPFLFSFAMGFLSRVNNLGRVSTLVNFSALTAYFSLLSLGVSGVVSDGFNIVQYDSVMLTVGIVGSALAHFLGGSVSNNLTTVTQPQKLFYALAAGLVPATLLCSCHSMNSFSSALLICVATPILVGFLAPIMTGASSPKTAAFLALAAASPLAFCGLLHIPMAAWFSLQSPVYVGSGFLPSVFRDLVYVTVLPSIAVILPVLGSTIGFTLGKTDKIRKLLFAKRPSSVDLHAAPQAVLLSANAAESCPLRTRQSIELPEQARL